jgi:serine protease Do
MKKGGCKAFTILLAVITASFLIVGTSPVPAQAAVGGGALVKELGEAFVEIAKKVKPAVVNIASVRKPKFSSRKGKDLDEFMKNHPLREFFGDDMFKRFMPFSPHKRGFVRRGLGSGVIVSPEGVILTNAHVVKQADEIKVTLSDKRSFDAKVIGVDPESDIAVIKIKAKNLPIAKLGNSDSLKVGEIVLAVGNPFGLSQTVTSGIVSAKGRTNMGIIDYEDFIQTDAAINPGNSGGPLVNMNGEVVGINTAIASRSGGYQGIGFAIPSNSAKLIMDELRKEGKVRRGLLGVKIQNITQSLAKSFHRKSVDGALVSEVIPGSPAEKAGVKSGDIILKFNDKNVAGPAELKNLVGRVKPGSKASLTVFRNGRELALSTDIGERKPKDRLASRSGEEAESFDELGVSIEPVPKALADKLDIKRGEGVRVKATDPNGLGARMGLKTGDIVLEIDGKAIGGTSAFNSAVTKAKKNGVIRLKVQRKKNRIYLGFDMD